MDGEFIEPNDVSRARRGERGGALLTVLMLSTLLLAVGGALIMVTTTATRTAVDSTAEMQAYYSAEAGVQQTLNVLRGNVAPNGAMGSNTQINFRKAVTPSDSNLPSDTTGIARLSGFLSYDYTPSGAANPDRVSLTSSYTPATGLAYSLNVTDPDNTPVTSGEPLRLLLRVTGYGPKGAVKQLDLVVKRSNFDYSPPATIMMRGSDDGTPVNFDIGASNAKDYSGHDHAGGTILPSFGATNDADTTIEVNSDGKDTAASPKAATIPNASLPSFLQSADQARAFVAEQKANAMSQGRYFTSFSGNSGSATNPVFTFVDGDASLSGGAGLLIVTGNLEMSGNPNFSGLILVLGTGTINRNGGGNGNIYGAIAAASFGNTGGFGFTAASFHTNGGGNSTIQYDSDAVRAALNVSGPRILGVAEY
ncbi:MAG TPA: hypothetical protein VE961_05485 [Pyrinomonadaceae bacterium]|nr:hypothetical protein [Pyrinomonadaceae bacterium]